jgi:hypothetical protein
MWLQIAKQLRFSFLLFGLARWSQPLTLTVGDLLNFAEDFATSANQLQKVYDWNISQWSSLGNTILTATFLSTCVVELYKASFLRPHLSKTIITGLVISLGLYLRCQFQITKLKKEFVAVYSLLASLRDA